MIAAIGLDELPIGEEFLEVYADLLAALGSRVAPENGTAIRHERIEVVGHGCLLAEDLLDVASASPIALATARAIDARIVD
jgi:hypothetical protein